MSNSFKIEKQISVKTYLYFFIVGLFSALFFCVVFSVTDAFGVNTTATILAQHDNGTYGILIDGYVTYVKVFGPIG